LVGSSAKRTRVVLASMMRIRTVFSVVVMAFIVASGKRLRNRWKVRVPDSRGRFSYPRGKGSALPAGLERRLDIDDRCPVDRLKTLHADAQIVDSEHGDLVNAERIRSML